MATSTSNLTPQTPDDFEERQAAWQLEKYEREYEEFWKDAGAQKYFPAISGLALDNEPETPVDALVPQIVYAGCINGLIGPPKAGKTTFILGALVSLLEQAKFLGEETKLPGPVLYITEQSKRSFKKQLDRLPSNMRKRLLRAKTVKDEPLFFLMHPEHHIQRGPKAALLESEWDRHMRLWMDAVRTIKPSLVIVDTFGRYAGFKEGNENDNGVIGSRINGFQKLIEIKESLAVLLLGHSSKKGSEQKTYLELTHIRGGSAFAGALDHAVLINRPKRGGKVSRTCYITIESRVTDEARFVVEWQEDGTYTRNDSKVPMLVAPDQKIDQVEKILTEEPELAKKPNAKIVEILKSRGVDVSEATVKRSKQRQKAVEGIPKIVKAESA